MTAAGVRSLIGRLRDEKGFGLVELLIALTVLSIGIFAIMATFGASYAALRHATGVSASSAVADAQMERYRARRYVDVQLNTAGEDAKYKGDVAYNATAEIGGCGTSDPSCSPTQLRTGPDGVSYRVDSYVDWSCVSGSLSVVPSPSCGSGQPAPLKLVTVVVRSSDGSRDWLREQSTFHPLSGS